MVSQAALLKSLNDFWRVLNRSALFHIDPTVLRYAPEALGSKESETYES